jgi:hypothetical protein
MRQTAQMRRSALVVVALLVGCTGGDEGDDAAVTTTTEAPTTTAAAETTTTTVAPDPFTVPADPADIDEAYVEAVLTELERINGDALRLAVSEGLSPAITELIRSIHSPESASLELQGYAIQAAESFPNVRPDPGDAIARVTALLSASASCISADVQLDLAAVSVDADSIDLRVELRPQATNAPGNSTPWVYWARDVLSDQTTSGEPCAAF